jgi:hypothetical protein
LKIKKKLLYINFFFSSWVIGTPVHFSGMTVRGQAVILKLNLSKSCDQKKSFYVVKKISKCPKNQKKNYIKFIFSGWVLGRPVHFSGMTVRGQAVILKLNFSKSCDHKKSFFYWGIAFEIRMFTLILTWYYTALENKESLNK